MLKENRGQQKKGKPPVNDDLAFDEDPLVLESADVIPDEDAIGGPSTIKRKGCTRKKKKSDTNSHLCEVQIIGNIHLLTADASELPVSDETAQMPSGHYKTRGKRVNYQLLLEGEEAPRTG